MPSFSMFYFHSNFSENPVFLNSFGLKSVLEKLYFRDSVVWMVALTVKKLRFPISLAQCGRFLTEFIIETNYPTPILY